MATNNAENMKNQGMQALTSAGTFSARTMSGAANQFVWTNGLGSAGDPTVKFAPSTVRATTQPFVVARKTANSASVTGDGTVYTVIFDTEVTDAGSNYDNTTGVFTAPIDGNYFICGSVRFNTLSTATIFFVTIVSTSISLLSTQKAAANIGSNTSMFLPFKGILRLAQNDTVSITVVAQGGTKTSGVFGGASVSTFLCISLLN